LREVRLESVSVRYPDSAEPAIRAVTLSIAAGTTVGFIGGSGAGKSTLVDVILGLLTPETGSVTVDGTSIQRGLRSWQDKIGYVPQTIFLTDDTLRRNIAFGLPDEQIDDGAVLRAIRSAQLDELVAESSAGIETVVGERGVRLSGGQRQRIGIARALYHDPPVLVLDEATSSLDIDTERGVMKAVRALHGQKTILIVAHRHSTVEHCDKLYRLEQGKIVEEGGAREVLRSATDLRMRTREVQ
jgi:ABC-type multidrug transport system fused ATPase/permease subunit